MLISKKLVGAHVPAKNALANAEKIGARSLSFFLSSPRMWKFKPFSPADESAFTAGAARLFQDNQSKFNCIMPHGPYLMNLCTPDLSVLEKSRNRLLEELAQCNRLGINLYNFHPGSNVRKEAVDVCVDRMHASLNFAHSHADSGNVVTVLESTAGSGSSIGGSFEQLAAIIAGVQDKSRVGICLDTCHMFAKGYDIRTVDGFQRTLDAFDKTVGFPYLKAMHVNDSLIPLGKKRDRHANLGKGEIGVEAFYALMKNPHLDGIPLILETPTEDTATGEDKWEEVYAQEIEMLYALEQMSSVP